MDDLLVAFPIGPEWSQAEVPAQANRLVFPVTHSRPTTRDHCLHPAVDTISWRRGPLSMI